MRDNEMAPFRFVREGVLFLTVLSLESIILLLLGVILVIF
jgi:hypothetical protein